MTVNDQSSMTVKKKRRKYVDVDYLFTIDKYTHV